MWAHEGGGRGQRPIHAPALERICHTVVDGLHRAQRGRGPLGMHIAWRLEQEMVCSRERRAPRQVLADRFTQRDRGVAVLCKVCNVRRGAALAACATRLRACF